MTKFATTNPWFCGVLKYRRTPRHIEQQYEKTKKRACAPSEDSDQSGNLPNLFSLCCQHGEALEPQITIISTCTVKTLFFKDLVTLTSRVVLDCIDSWSLQPYLLWSDWVDAKADLSLCWVHMPLSWFHYFLFVWFDLLRSSQQFFSHVGKGLPVLKQY